MFGLPEGLLNGRQGFGPIGQLPMDPRNNMRQAGQVGYQQPQQPMQGQMARPALNMQPQILGAPQQQQKQLFGPR